MFENDRKVSFNIASKASYVSILSGQKFINNTKNSRFGEFFENLEQVKSGGKKRIFEFCQKKKLRYLVFFFAIFVVVAKGEK